MVSSIHEYTDSEEEGSPPPHNPNTVHATATPATISGPTQEARIEASGSASASVEKSPKVNTGTRVKLTLRPSINHLIHNEPTQPASQSHSRSDRSSLSPPPSITLKLGMPRSSMTTSASIAEKASYSSSEDEASDHDDGQSHDLDNLRPAKKPRKSNSNTSPSKKKKVHPPPPHTTTHPLPIAPAPALGLDPSLPAAHRKSYDWLQPSTAGASHHGPPERSRITGWAPGDEELVSKAEVEEKPKKSHHKKKPEGNPSQGGTGKGWRKGQKKPKGMPIPWKENGTFVESGPGTITPGDMTPLEGSPEPGSVVSDLPPPTVPRAPSPPFVAADADKLGFPVFSKPIVAPKINLGPFPKVTQYFQPNNGGDTGHFPRKEKVRTFKLIEKQLIGIGSGTLKYNSWARGPPSELARLIQADKEAKELNRQKSKIANSTPIPAPDPSAGWESRPPLISNISSDSTPTASVLESAYPLEDVDVVSEVGDGDESVISTKETQAAQSPAPSARTRGGKAKPKPRKSKLAQEITVSESTSAIEEVI